ncbi:hypothetical protein BC936DRAFT_148717 [Jimgerdemannia flammicorona]|uniref:Uncharacterized protein n=2 Tax=Jimgerdemannia flammicorona TaxID=994334 RepID=A0A433QJU4_9FUNG|nr:hypothetical protein BC936DRAFT_148717 [Jimgerdemannia flammicorona]RUS30024.1 hypothetical protein BC938DRAFT_479939 [Jimgerdemannia flammicorona]
MTKQHPGNITSANFSESNGNSSKWTLVATGTVEQQMMVKFMLDHTLTADFIRAIVANAQFAQRFDPDEFASNPNNLLDVNPTADLLNEIPEDLPEHENVAGLYEFLRSNEFVCEGSNDDTLLASEENPGRAAFLGEWYNHFGERPTLLAAILDPERKHRRHRHRSSSASRN